MYTLDDTIAAITTPLGQGGIGVVRIAGPHARTIADSLVRCTPPLLHATTHTVHFGRIYDGSTIIDECLATVMHAPRTYTGDDTVELSMHGGPIVVRQVLSLCLRQGARHAGPGEFTYRAFARGKMDLARAESVCDLIRSKTLAAARASVRVLEGGLSRHIHDWRTQLLDMLAHLEAAIDHSDEDLSFMTPAQCTARLDALCAGIAQLQAHYTTARHLRNGIRAVICGRPNVGKSSLLNALLARDRALVSPLAGTTRDTIEETLDIGGIPVVITDTAGLRSATTDPIERMGHDRAYAALSTADVVLWVIDGSTAMTDEDTAIAAHLTQAGLTARTIALINKADLPGHRTTLPHEVGITQTISATTREGLPALEAHILALAGETASDSDTLLVNERHCAALTQAAATLSAARALIDPPAGMPAQASDDLLAFHVREALACLGTITGETADDEILERIFSHFCVGK